MEHLFICSLAYLFIFFGEASVKVLACFIIGLCWYSWVLRVLYMFWLAIFYVFWEYFLLVLGLSSHLFDSVFSRAEINFNEIQFISVFFRVVVLVLWSSLNLKSLDFLSWVSWIRNKLGVAAMGSRIKRVPCMSHRTIFWLVYMLMVRN